MKLSRGFSGWPMQKRPASQSGSGRGFHCIGVLQGLEDAGWRRMHLTGLENHLTR